MSTTSPYWHLKEAKKISEIKKELILSTGFSPSGPPHIGTGGEIIRTRAIQNVLKDNYNKNTRLICICDDMDPLRKIPRGCSSHIEQHLQKPLITVPDSCHSNYAEHNTEILKKFLLTLNIDCEIISSAACYKSGLFNEWLKKILYKHEEIQEIVKRHIGKKRAENYSPFMPIDKNTGKLLQTEIIKTDIEQNLIVFKQNDKYVEQSILYGDCKLQWKADWAMRWGAFKVDYEMYGKDMIDTANISKEIANVLNITPPQGMHYELFVDINKKKMSKSKGEYEINMETLIKYLPQEVLFLFICQNPYKPRSISIKTIPKIIDDYILYVKNNPQDPYLEYITGTRLQISTLNFSTILHLMDASIDQSFVTSKISEHIGTKFWDKWTKIIYEKACAYYNNIILPQKQKRELTIKEKEICQTLIDHLLISKTKDEIKLAIYAIGNSAYGKTHLNQWFELLYQVFFAQKTGPRMHNFIYFYGIEESIKIIKQAF